MASENARKAMEAYLAQLGRAPENAGMAHSFAEASDAAEALRQELLGKGGVALTSIGVGFTSDRSDHALVVGVVDDAALKHVPAVFRGLAVQASVHGAARGL
jgi:hypothetical protein